MEDAVKRVKRGHWVREQICEAHISYKFRVWNTHMHTQRQTTSWLNTRTEYSFNLRQKTQNTSHIKWEKAFYVLSHQEKTNESHSELLSTRAAETEIIYSRTEPTARPWAADLAHGDYWLGVGVGDGIREVGRRGFSSLLPYVLALRDHSPSPGPRA